MMRGRQALLAVLLVALVVGSGFAGATALGAPAPTADQTPSVDQTVTRPASKNVTRSENESNSSGPTVADGWSPPTDKGSSNVSSRLGQHLDANQSGPAVGGNRQGSDAEPSTVEIVVEASPGEGDRAADVVSRAGGKVTARHDDLVQVRIPESAVQGIANKPAIEFARLPIRPSTNEVTSQGVGTMNASWAQDQNVTGENVTVAAIDLEGFNLKNDEIGDQVVDHKDFTGAGIGNGSSGLHGTAVAELVADTAPNASLVTLRANSLVQWYNAVGYIREETDTDVVVMSMSYYAVGPLDGTSQMNQEISSLRGDGILWVNSAGNAADGGHWNGTWSDPNEDGWMNFAADDQWLRLDSGTEANIVVNWNDWENTNEDYDLYILDDSGNIIGESTNAQNDDQDRPIEWYVNTSVDGPLYLGIKNTAANGNSDFDIWFRGDLTPEYWTAERSVTNPGVGPDALTVGAVHYRDTQIEDFSSRGPTIDGRQKPDVVAPDGVDTTAYSGAFYGTSAAAPHAAGVAALLADVNESISPTEIERAVLDTAIDVNGTEPDTTYGDGLIDAKGTVAPQLISTAVDQSAVDFGSVNLDDSATSSVTLENDGQLAMEVTDMSIEGENASEFTIAAGGGSHTLDVGETHDIDIRFDSTDRGGQQASLRIEHNGSESPRTVSLKGETIAPNIHATPDGTLDFGTVTLENATANQTIVITNNGTAPLNVTDATISGENASEFGFAADSPQPDMVLESGASETVTIHVQVDSVGEQNATIVFDHNVSDRAVVERSLTAQAVDRTPPTIAQVSAVASGDETTAVGRDRSVTIAVNASDVSGIGNVTVDATPLGNETVNLSAENGDWFNETVPVDDNNATAGKHTLGVTVADTQNNAVSAETDTVLVDLTNASLAIETPAPNTAQNETTINVTGTADDSLSGVDNVSVQIDDGAWITASLTGSNWYHNHTSLSEGKHNVSVQAMDGAGNVGPLKTRTVIIDRTAPVIDGASLEPTTGLLPDDSVPVSVTARDEALSVSSVTVEGTALANETGTWNGTVTTQPALGSHTVPVTVTDRAGNVNGSTISYSVGRNATLSPLDKSRYRATPDDPGIGTVTINTTVDIAGKNITVGAARTNPTTDSPPNDTALAFPQIETPVPNNEVENASVEVLVDQSRIDDQYVLPETMRFWVHNGSAWNRSQAERIVGTSSAVPFELHTTHFSTFAVTGDVDETPPTITERTPSDGATITDTEPTIGAAYDDDRAGIDSHSVTLILDDTEVTSGLTVSSSSLSHTPTLEPGSHTVKLSVADAVGNTREDSWEFTIEDPSSDASSGGSSGGGGGGGGGQSSNSGAVGAKGVSIGISGNQPTITISGGMPVESVGFVSASGIDASVSIEELGEVSHDPPDGKSFVTGADITFNSGDEDDVDAVRMGIPQDHLDERGVEPSQLSLNHYESQYAEWEELETTVVRTDGGVVVVEAPSVGFSEYVVFAKETPNKTTSTTELGNTTTEKPTTTPTTTEAPTPTEASTSTEAPTTTETPPATSGTPDEGGPGPVLIGGIVIVVLAIIAALYLAFGRE